MSPTPRSSSSGKSRRSPITTAEDREFEMTNLAYDQARLQLQQGTAPAPIVNYFLKLGSTRDKLEIERLERENLLLEKKVEQLESATNIERLLESAQKAMTTYQGRDDYDYDEYDD